MLELSKEDLTDLYHLPFRVAEQSIYFDVMEFNVNLENTGMYSMNAMYKASFLMIVSILKLAPVEYDIIKIPIIYSNSISSDEFSIKRDLLIQIESDSMDRSINEFIEEQLSKIRTPLRHIESISFTKI